MLMEGDQDDHPCPESIVLSQTCWEYRTLLGEEHQSAQQQQQQPQPQQQQQHHVPSVNSSQATRSIAPATRTDAAAAGTNTSPTRTLKTSKSRKWSSQDQGEHRRSKQSKKSPPADRAHACPGTTWLRTLRLEGNDDDNNNQSARGSWDIFVLVLQASGLQRITSKRGSELDFGTLLIADQSLSFFRLTLWGKTARAAGRLVRAGDLVRFNGIGVSTFRGTVQATSTFSTSFRVVWRGDAFTTPQDAPTTTMLAHGWSASRAPGERRQFDPGPVLSQDDGLKVSREAGCTLAAWAKSEFPSVTSSEPYGQEQKHRRQQQATAAITEDTMDGGLGGVSSGAGSLGAVRKGVETTVYACVLEVSHVEKLWVWESAGGKRTKDLVSRATALLTDGRDEMTLQLWGDIASDDTMSVLREGADTTAAAVAVVGTTRQGSARQQPVLATAVFEFTRLLPSFSFSCEALVLNGKSGSVRKMEFDSAEAVSVSGAVLAAAAAMPDAGADTLGAEDPSEGEEHHQKALASVDASHFFVPTRATREAGARKFGSVAALMSADRFSGAAHLRKAVVRKVDDVPFVLPTEPPAPCAGGGGVHQDESSPMAALGSSGGGDNTASPSVAIFIGDPEDSRILGGDYRSADAPAILRATAEGGALRDLMGCVPGELLVLTRGSDHVGSTIAADAAMSVARSFLDGLQVGGEQGETVDVVLAVRASVDGNDRVIPGGSSYRIVSLRPNFDG